jgi:hypothetical protein
MIWGNYFDTDKTPYLTLTIIGAQNSHKKILKKGLGLSYKDGECLISVILVNNLTELGGHYM